MKMTETIIKLTGFHVCATGNKIYSIICFLEADLGPCMYVKLKLILLEHRNIWL